MIPICHIQVLPLMSGVQRAMLEILRFLDRDTFEPHVVCQSAGPLTEELKSRDIAFHLVPELGRPIRPWKDLQARWALTRLFRHHRFQLVHNHSAKPRAIGSFAARQASIPFVVNHIQGYPFHRETPRLVAAVYRRIEAKVASLCDQTIFVNHEDHRYAIASRLVHPSRSTMIYNGIDLDLFSPDPKDNVGQHFRDEFHLGNDVIIVFLGRLDKQKQPLILPEIAAKLDAMKTKQPWRIVVVGDGEFLNALQHAIHTSGMMHRIRMIGWHTQPAEVLRAADIMLLPSLWEGLPLTLIEAQAAGIPCVASDIRGNREALCAETGRLVDPKDASEFAAALAPLVDNPFLRKTMGLAARRRAEQLFDTVENNRRIIALYCNLLGLPAPAVIPAARAA